MDDRDLLIARRMCVPVGLCHPMDWVRFRDSHTPHEWCVQRLMDQIEPLGEERADMRAGAMVAQLARAIRSEEALSYYELGQSARNYLAINQPDDDRVLLPEEAAELRK